MPSSSYKFDKIVMAEGKHYPCTGCDEASPDKELLRFIVDEENNLAMFSCGKCGRLIHWKDGTAYYLNNSDPNYVAAPVTECYTCGADKEHWKHELYGE